MFGKISGRFKLFAKSIGISMFFALKEIPHALKEYFSPVFQKLARIMRYIQTRRNKKHKVRELPKRFTRPKDKGGN